MKQDTQSALLTGSAPASPGAMTALVELLLISPNCTLNYQRIEELLKVGKNPPETAWKYAIEAAFCFDLLDKGPENSVTLKKEVQKLKNSDLVSVLPTISLKNLLNKTWTPALFDDEEKRSAKGGDLAIGMTWLLAQSPWNQDSLENVKLEELHLAQFETGKAPNKVNPTQLRAIKRWSRYFGLGYDDPFGGASFIPEPSLAIRRVLDNFPKEYMPASKFFAELAKILPLLDGGTLRNNTFKNLKENRLIHEKNRKQISATLSLAIIRLEKQGFISTDYQNDSNKTDHIILLLPESEVTLSRVKVKKYG